MTLYLEQTVTMEVITCGGCGVVYGMTTEFYNLRLKDKKGFNCPNGCNRVFTGKTEAEKLKEQLEQTKSDYERRLGYVQNEKNSLVRDLNSERSKRGHVTRKLNKIKNGICPCCDLHFNSVREHMKAKHPDFDPENPKADE